MGKNYTDHADIREGVRALCAKFPGEYCARSIASAAIRRISSCGAHRGGLSRALIPEEFGAAGSA